MQSSDSTGAIYNRRVLRREQRRGRSPFPHDENDIIMNSELATTPNQIMTSMAASRGGMKSTLIMPAEKCWAQYDSIIDVNLAATRIAISHGKQATVQDLGDVIVVEIG